MSNYNVTSKNAQSGKLEELSVKKFLEKHGFSVEIVSSFDDDGNETYQHYVYVDGNNYPHPDFIVTRNDREFYIEVKSSERFYSVPVGRSVPPLESGEEYLLIRKYHFDSYLKLSRWKEIPAYIFFVVSRDDRWFASNLEKLLPESGIVKNPYPRKNEDFYFWKRSFIEKKFVKDR